MNIFETAKEVLTEAPNKYWDAEYKRLFGQIKKLLSSYSGKRQSAMFSISGLTKKGTEVELSFHIPGQYGNKEWTFLELLIVDNKSHTIITKFDKSANVIDKEPDQDSADMFDRTANLKDLKLAVDWIKKN